jgi:hypothetical protein
VIKLKSCMVRVVPAVYAPTFDFILTNEFYISCIALTEEFVYFLFVFVWHYRLGIRCPNLYRDTENRTRDSSLSEKRDNHFTIPQQIGSMDTMSSRGNPSPFT